MERITKSIDYTSPLGPVQLIQKVHPFTVVKCSHLSVGEVIY